MRYFRHKRCFTFVVLYSTPAAKLPHISTEFRYRNIGTMEDQTKGRYDLCKISFQVCASRGRKGRDVLQGRLIAHLAFVGDCKMHDFLSE